MIQQNPPGHRPGNPRLPGRAPGSFRHRRSGSPVSPRRTAPDGCKPNSPGWAATRCWSDEVGYIPFEAKAANLFFQLVSAGAPRAELNLGLPPLEEQGDVEGAREALRKVTGEGRGGGRLASGLTQRHGDSPRGGLGVDRHHETPARPTCSCIWGGAAAAGARGAAGGAGSVAVAVGACRALVRSGLIETVPRRCRGEKWRPWERGSPMELWQMDVVGGIGLADGSELKALTGSAGLPRRPCSSVGSAAGWDQSRPRSRARSRASERDATPSFW